MTKVIWWLLSVAY